MAKKKAAKSAATSGRRAPARRGASKRKDPGDFRRFRPSTTLERAEEKREKIEAGKVVKATRNIIVAALLIISSYLPKSKPSRNPLLGSKAPSRKTRIAVNQRNGRKVMGYLWKRPDGKRLRTLFSGQWADMMLADFLKLAKKMGFQGVELAMWHIDRQRALYDDSYIEEILSLFRQNGLELVAISDHLVGQCVCDRIEARHKGIVPDWVWGDGEPNGVNERAAIELMNTGRVAQRLGVKVVNGFTGSSIWHLWYDFPPAGSDVIQAGFDLFANRFTPILDLYAELGIVFALEVHPTEIAFDIETARRALEAIEYHPAFGFNFDPSHLLWQGVDPAEFLLEFGDRIYHCHVKDATRRLKGRQGILGSFLSFGDFFNRGWEFVSVGRGSVKFGVIIRALNKVGYWGPLSVEWEDSSMDRVMGATESCVYVERCDFMPSNRRMDEAFKKGDKKKKKNVHSNRRPGSLAAA